MLLTALLSLAAFHGFHGSRAAAQDRAAMVPVPIGGSQMLEMSKKQRIKDIDNKDQNVARVDFVAGSDYRKVMIIGGGAAGLTRLVLTDADNNKEVFDIVVEQNLEFLRRVLSKAAPTANIEVVQSTGSTLVLTGTVAQAADIDIIMRAAAGTVGKDNIVNAMRIGGVQQVQLDVVIARVARSEARTLGFNFFTNGNKYFFGSTVSPDAGPGQGGSLTNSVGSFASSLVGPPTLALGIINNHGAFLGLLEALRTENLVKLLAQPKVCTLSGRPATFVSGGEQAVPTLASGSAGGGAVSGVDFKPFGTTVRFLPLVLGGGKIYLEVEPEFTFPDPTPLFSAPVNGGTVFGRTTQRVQTSAVLEDGQTLAIGGLIFHQVNGTATKVPVLGDLPWLGTAFREMQYNVSEEELLILITPHLVDALACNQLPKCLPGEETRKPDDYELFLEGILEAPRGQREVFQCDKYVPAYKNGPTGNMFPSPTCNGPRGACDFGSCSGPACVPDRGCPSGGCQAGGCGQGVVNGPRTQGVNPAAGQPNAAPVPPVPPPPPLQQTQGTPQPQQLPETRTQFQRPLETVPVVDAPRAEVVSVTSDPAPEQQVPEAQQVQQVSGPPAATLAAPTPLEDPR